MILKNECLQQNEVFDKVDGGESSPKFNLYLNTILRICTSELSKLNATGIVE